MHRTFFSFFFIIIGTKQPLFRLYPYWKSFRNTNEEREENKRQRGGGRGGGSILNRSGVFWKLGKFKSPQPLGATEQWHAKRKETPLNYSQWRCLMGETINFRARKRFAYWICPTDFAFNGLWIEHGRKP